MLRITSACDTEYSIIHSTAHNGCLKLSSNGIIRMILEKLPESEDRAFSWKMNTHGSIKDFGSKGWQLSELISCQRKWDLKTEESFGIISKVVSEKNQEQKKKQERSITFSRALTSTTVLISRAIRLSFIDLATSGGVLGLALKNENDMVIGSAMNSLYLYLSLFPFPLLRNRTCWSRANYAADIDAVVFLTNLLFRIVNYTSALWIIASFDSKWEG